MKLTALLALLLCGGCSLNKFVPPPYAGAIVEHNRFLGITAAYQGYGFRVGWGSQVWCLIPVSTNKIYAAPISDTCKIGAIGPTTIIEDLQTFPPEGPPPAPRFNRLFSPKDADEKKTSTPIENH